MKTHEELLNLLEEDEGLTLEFKDSRILSSPFKIARVLTAFANAEGGTLLVGINDDKSIEGMKAKREHEEHIMNIASDKCDPRLYPEFERISLQGNGDVYVIHVPERKGPYHAVRTKHGYKFFIRVGSTIREMSPSELRIGERGVEIPVKRGLGAIWSWLGKKILQRFWGKLDVNILGFQMTLVVLALLLIGIPLVFMFRFREGSLVTLTYSTWEYIALAISLGVGTVLIDWFQYTPRTKCPRCSSYFSFHTVRKWVFEKRTISEELEEWLTRSQKRCNECDYMMFGKLKYERVRLE